VRAVDQWKQIQDGLPADWTEIKLAFEPEGSVGEAAAVLAPLGPGRSGGLLLLEVTREASGAERLRTVLASLDRQRIWGTLRVVETEVGAVPDRRPAGLVAPVQPLVERWDAMLATLPPDWSDLLVELELDSSDYVPRAALLGAPANPTRVKDELALRFRTSSRSGYGVSAAMARRCLERMDAEGISGRLRPLIEVSDADGADTQGVVWRVAGRSV
jgi:hypothetical protein